MNSTERKMLDLLKKGRDEFGVVAVKAEFEAEGTRPDEFLRLLHLAHCAGLKVALKIGGCEAISDLFASKLYGVDHIIAPMVETPYALRKFIEAKAKTHGANEEGVQFLYNLETKTALANMDDMLRLAKGGIHGKKGVDGIVFGRVDFTMSNDLTRDDINRPVITQAVLKVAELCRTEGLQLVVGGGISTEAVTALREIRSVRLDRFETRKVVFDGSAIEQPWIDDAIANAVEFEVCWLENKQEYYSRLSLEDAERIGMIRRRQAMLEQPVKMKAV